MKSLIILLVALCAATLCSNLCLNGAAADTGKAAVEPSEPLLNVPFRVTASFLKERENLYISLSSTCDISQVAGAICTLTASRTCEFTVSGTSVNISAQYDSEVPLLYLCSSAFSHSVPIQTVQLSVIDVMPRFVITRAPFAVTLNNATPLGTVIGFFSDDACRNPVSGMSPVEVGYDRRLSLTFTSASVIRLCAKVPFSNTGSGGKLFTSYVPAATLLGVDAFSVDKTEVFRHTTEEFDLSPFNQIPFASFSPSSNCIPLKQEPVSGNMLQRVRLPIHVPRGSYYLCTGLAYYMRKRLFVPSSNPVVVRAYGLQPHTMYNSLSTTVTLTLDAATPSTSASSDTMSAALFSSPNCQGNPIIAWSTSRTWTVPSAGLYYACVRGTAKTQPTALAANVTVIDAPSVSLSRSPAIGGLPLTVTLSGRAVSSPGIITVGLSLTASSCSKLVASGKTTTTGTVATFLVPQDVLPTMTLCVSTPLLESSNAEDNEDADRGYTYASSSVTTQGYNISYGPLFVGVPGTIKLDSTVSLDAGTTGIFGQGSCNNVIGKPFFMNEASLNNVVFESAGLYALCVKLAGSSSSSSSSSVESSYTQIANVLVYGPVNLSPYSIVMNVLKNVKVSLLPPSAPVRILDTNDCNAKPLFKGTANNGGEATIPISYNKEAKLTVCAGYRGNNNQGEWSFKPMGILPVTQVTVLPKAIITSQVNRLNFIVPDKTSLTGLQAFVVSAAGGSCAMPSTPRMNMSIPGEGRAYILFTPSTSSTWTLCLSTTGNNFVSVGAITSVSQLTITAGSSDRALNLPVRLQLGGSSLNVLQPTRFFVTDTPNSCTHVQTSGTPVYAEGNMDAFTGEVNSFVMKQVGSFTVCVGWQDEESEFFVYGVPIQVASFKSLSRYAIRESTNNLRAFPLPGDTTLFLVACPALKTCNTLITAAHCKEAPHRYYTSSLVPLRGAAVGKYVLCQEDAKDGTIIASESLINVVDPFVVTFTDNDVRQYKPVSVTLSGGDVKTRDESVTISTMPADVNCDSFHPQRQEFVFPASQLTGSITITDMEPYVEGAQLCLTASPNDVFSVGVFNFLPYMSPATVITDRKVSVRSGMWETGVVAKLTATNNCAGNVMNTEPVLIHGYVSELFVDGCANGNADLTTVYYCESKNGLSAYELRGMMRLIRLKNCAPNKPAAITPVTVPPSQILNNYGIDTTLLMNPVLSRTSDCLQLVQQSVNSGYAPRFDENARFFVCVNAKGDPGYQFTTDTPTLTIMNHKALPTSIPSRLSASVGVTMKAVLKLNYKTGTTDTFLSHSANCDSTIVNTPDLGREPPRSQLLLTGVSGIKYICVVRHTDATTTATIPVARVLAVNPPQANQLDPALVRGAPFHANLQLVAVDGQSPTYSLLPGADSGYATASFYASNFRGIYLSSDLCRSVLSGTDVTHVRSSGHVAIPTSSIDTDLTTFSLCAGTPAGNLTVETEISLSTDIIFPSQFVLGADKEVYVPLSPTSVFHLRKNEDCSGSEFVPPFSTDEDGRGTLSLKSSSGNGLPPSGKWTLCEEQITSPMALSVREMNGKAHTASTKSLNPLTIIQTFDPVYFNIRGTVVIVGVPSVSVLLDSLTADFLLPGFSRDRSCTNRGESYGSWRVSDEGSSTTAKSISIHAKEPVGSIYMCATAPINNTIVSLPTSNAFNFLAPSMSLPSTVSRCDPLMLDSCAIPGASSSSAASLIVIKGDCCNMADRGNIVGRSSQSADGHCTLTMDTRRLNAFPIATDFSVCGVDSTDTSYCPTLGRVRVDEEICAGDVVVGGKHSIATGARIAIGILAALLALLIIALIIWLVLRCRRKRKHKKDKHAIGPAAVNPFLLEGPVMLELRGTSAAQRTITITPSTDRTSLSASPPATDMRLWEDGESDARDQLALQEARDRYHMRLIFTEGLERLRVAAKERDLLFELSGDDEGVDENGARVDYNKSNTNREAPVAVGLVASAPPTEDFDPLYVPHPPVEVPLTGTGSNPIAVAGVVLRDGHISSSPSPRNPRATPSPASSIGTLSYTTTQRFHDERRYTLENEAVRRQRILNWEEEEWHGLVDSEFTSYVRLQQSMEKSPAPPAPDVVVLPFASAFTEVEVGNNNRQEEEGEDDIYDAPDIPVQMVKYNNNSNNIHDNGATTAVVINAIPEEMAWCTPSGRTGENEEMSSGDTIFSGSIPSTSKTQGETNGVVPKQDIKDNVQIPQLTPEKHKRRPRQEKLGREGSSEANLEEASELREYR
ncbi:hypothetical protein LSM04_004866 [Trypanosoma melophagium]|uniref:uncharacterized protein n=1 Tax=Trypanosoma melophagium TaxID=715481 RepID=UPI00351A2BA1|nr:hypothetical protein LSM04_004866 [Trypanosoma melophagium]